MSLEQLKSLLESKPGYLKKGPQYLADTFGVSKNAAKKALRSAKQNRVTPTVSVKNATQQVAQMLVAEGKYQEAIDMLAGLKKQEVKPLYSATQFKSGNYVVIGCTHLPFHNKKMWTAMCNYIKDTDIAGIVLAGDILDMHSISRHAKGLITLPGYDLGREYKEANEALDELDDAIGSRPIKKEYFYGNHEDWYNQNQKEVQSVKMGTAGITDPYNACFAHRNYNTQFNWKTAQVIIGNLTIMHGEWCNKHSAHKHLIELKTNVLFFHTHRFQVYSESGLTTYNAGGGYDRDQLVFGYMSRAQKLAWKNGFATVHLTNEGNTHVTTHEWNDELFINGKIYK